MSAELETRLLRIESTLRWYETRLFQLIAANEGGTTVIPAFPGRAKTNRTWDGFYFEIGRTITKITLVAKTFAPTGQDMQVEVLIDGASTVPATVATLTDGDSYEETDITDLDVLTEHRVGLKQIQVGTTMEGSDIDVILHHK